MKKLTPMDVQQRRLIKVYCKHKYEYLSICSCKLNRYTRVTFGRATWTTSSYTKLWFNSYFNGVIYNVCRRKWRFNDCVK